MFNCLYQNKNSLINFTICHIANSRRASEIDFNVGVQPSTRRRSERRVKAAELCERRRRRKLRVHQNVDVGVTWSRGLTLFADGSFSLQ